MNEVVNMVLILILAPLALTGLLFIAALFRAGAAADGLRPRPIAICLGAVTDFFDTLGIGSFAPTMAWMKLQRLVSDALIPSTMVAGHALPTLVQSAVFLILLGALVKPALLIGCIIAMLMGGQVGAPLARHSPVRVVQLLVAVALLIAATFYVSTNLGVAPHSSGTAALNSKVLAIAVALNFLLGVLMNFGVGTYAPTLLVFSLLGIDPRLAFPVMSSACAYGMIASGARLVREKGLDLQMVSGIALGGVPAVLVAAFIVKTMPLMILRWLVVAVVLYAAGILLKSALGRTGAREPVMPQVSPQ